MARPTAMFDGQCSGREYQTDPLPGYEEPCDHVATRMSCLSIATPIAVRGTVNLTYHLAVAAAVGWMPNLLLSSEVDARARL
jgi:hypothetical protein